MNGSVYLKVFAVLLFINASGVQAVDSKANTLPVIERQVVKISAVANNGVSISIPRAALTVRNGVPGVFVVVNNEARFRMVRPGKTGKVRVEILSGLFGNETLIIDDLQVVHDGSPVKSVSTKSPDKK